MTMSFSYTCVSNVFLEQIVAPVPVSEWGYDQSVSVPQVFIAELELSVTNVDITVFGFFIPTMA